jgi:hexosaminidase
MTLSIRRLAVCAAGLALVFSTRLSAEEIRAHDLIPAPESFAWGKGRLALDSNFSVAVTGVKDARVEEALKRWTQRLQKRTGLHLVPAPAGKPVMTVECKKAGLPVQSVREDEAYVLVVTDKAATLSAPNALGILRGLETLLQLVGNEGGPGIPAVTVSDKPRFPWRGLLIDVGRHFEPLEVLKRNIDGMAEAKLNVLHWHLSDDQGFRVESKKFPKLQGLGSDGNFYTQEQVKEIVAYARARGIRTVPEFDIPGHATSWLVGYPELAAGPGPYAIERHFGIFNPTLDPSREEVYKFLDGFVGEMAALFPDEYFHVGGDEVTGREWNESSAIQIYMNKLRLKTFNDLQAHFNVRLSSILSKHGRKMVGWDEIMNPLLPKNMVVQSWRGTEGLTRSAQKGSDCILSNGFYLDLMYPASTHYAVDPLPSGIKLSTDGRTHVLGGEACMWAEFVTPETIDSRIWPRLLAIAERLWSPQEIQDVESLYRRMEIEAGRLEDLGLQHRANYRPMLERLVGKESAPALQALADVVTPVKRYARGNARDYTSLMPLTRLVDAARPESETARRFEWAVDDWLRAGPQTANPEPLRAPLQAWKKSHAVLGPIIEKSEGARDAYAQSQDLSESARLGLEAVDMLHAGKQAPAAWSRGATAALTRALQPRAELDLAVAPAILKLVLVAKHWDNLKALPPAEREAALKTRLDVFSVNADED